MPAQTSPVQHFTRYQKFVVGALAFLQFTIILDFMILSPLSAIMLPALKIAPSQFSFVVSVYAFAAGSSGLLAAGFADKFDRKKLLLFFYCGFVVGTFLCGIADSYPFLVGARLVTGVFGGVIGSIISAITTDLFPLAQRGRVMGVLSSAFAASQVLGLPLGLYLANRWNWHMPFLMIVGVSLCVGLVIFRYLKPIDAHLKFAVDKNVFHHLLTTVTRPRYVFGFCATALLSMGGFMMMPFSSAFAVNNLGVDLAHLPAIYLVNGIATMILGPVIGRLSDRFGKYNVYVFGAAFGSVMVVYYTHMGITPLWGVILVSTLMFIGIFSRMIPAQALMSGVPEAKSRGSYMSVSASMQQIAGGFGAMVAGQIIVQEASGHIQHFDILGYILVGTSFLSAIMLFYINRMVLVGAQASDVVPVETLTEA